jgi:hypothetical protein
MARTDTEVIDVLNQLYDESFAGKEGQRFVLAWSDLRAIYGFRKLFSSRFHGLAQAATDHGLYLWDLGEGESGHLVAVIKVNTVDRWRRVPRRVVDRYKIAPAEDGVNEADDDD